MKLESGWGTCSVCGSSDVGDNFVEDLMAIKRNVTNHDEFCDHFCDLFVSEDSLLPPTDHVVRGVFKFA